MMTRGQRRFRSGYRPPLPIAPRVACSLLVLLFLGPVAILGAQEGVQQGRGGGSAPDTVFTIRGRIYMPSGAPADEQLRVTLKTFSQGIAQELYSDSVGNFEFKNIPSNSYELVVWGTDRFETTTERVEVYGRMGRIVPQNIFLVPKEKERKPRNAGSVVSVGELRAKIPRDAERSYQRGTKLVKEKRYDESIAFFRQAITVFPEFFQALNDLGVQYVRLKRFDEALEVLHRAIALAPKAPQPWINVGHAMIQRGTPEEALVPLGQAVELDSSIWLTHLLLGIVHYRAGDYLSAQQEYEKALVLGEMPQVAVAHLHIANIHIRQRDFTRAIRDCERYLKSAPDGLDAPEALAKVNLMRQTMTGETIEISDPE
ncbi:MAG: tetratricopeptide repeat protein [Acidobacteria bacterium]|nr:tetratricopeptide repeat protein [Acidobacteriota bacterium]